MVDWNRVMAGRVAAETSAAAESPRPRPIGRVNRLAVTALICACVVGFLIGGILATVFGLAALEEIDDSDGQERGELMAKWAIGLGFVNIALSLALIVLLVAILL